MPRATPLLALDRRAFLKRVAGVGGAALATAYALPAWAEALPGGAAAWRDQIGLQLFTVRDRFPTDYPGTLQAVARIGYREVQTTLTYGEHTPQQIKSYLEAARLAAPTTHVSPVVGPDFERTLEGYQLIGHRYTTVAFGRRGGAPGAGRGPGGGAPGGGAPGGTSGAAGAPPAPRPAPPAQTLDAVKRTAEQLNQAGLVTKRYGMKVIVHNHTEEFAPLADASQRPYDVLLAETDPALVAMELDIGWAAVAGQGALELFRQAPGRFEVWHVKDIAGLKALDALGSQAERQRAARIVPLGEGELDYRAVFAAAAQAGMKHFYVEQDSAPQSGDSLAAAATSYRHLAKLLA